MKKKLLLYLMLFPFVAEAGQRDTCYTGLYLKNIYDLRPEEYAYTVDFWVWFDYSHKNFDPLNNIELINAKQISFADPYHADADRQVLLASESAKAIMIHEWKLKNYPFDRQVLQIQLEAVLILLKCF